MAKGQKTIYKNSAVILRLVLGIRISGTINWEAGLHERPASFFG